jgi:hypothetical protein
MLYRNQVIERDDMAQVPRYVLLLALHKARIEYARACERDGQKPGREDECWAEFEHLAEYVE